MVRIVENNDWVIITLVICLFTYAFMFISLLRDIRLKDFFTEIYADTSNTFLSWIITSVVFCTVGSILISQYVPIVPKTVTNLQIFGLELNKFGYTFICVLIFYFLKTVFSYFFYSGIGNSRKWGIFYFSATKYYFALSLIIIILCIAHYYFNIDKRIALNIYLIFLSFAFVFKVFFYLFHKNEILPNKWYYKILYICTLQIAPLFALWRVLFF